MNILLFMFAVMIFMLSPLLLSDNEMFIINNPSISPLHIVPEWYYLFAYAILRSIPNKLFGVIAFTISVLLLSLITVKNNMNNVNLILIMLLILIVINLTYPGYIVADVPYIIVSSWITFIYFTLIVCIML